MKIIKLPLVFSLLFLLNQSITACSCENHHEFNQEEYNELDMIFTGKVVEISSKSPEHTIIKFQVIEQIKGESKNGFVYADNSQADCSILTKKGEHFLLFLYGKNGQSNISKCSRIVAIKNIDQFTLPSALTFCMNKRDGIDISKYPNEILASSGRLKNQIPEGNWEYFYDNGKKKAFGKYLNGKKDSLWSFYHQDGALRTVNYKNGVLEGKWTNFHAKGWKESEWNFVDGIRQGISKGFYRDGNLHWEYEFVDGVSVNKIEHYRTGKKKYSKSNDLERHMYESGKIKTEIHFVAGQKDYQKIWFENGQLKRHIIETKSGDLRIKEANKRDGTVMVKDGNGFYEEFGMKGKYKNTRKEGTWTEHFGEGLLRETDYVNGIKEGVFKQWNNHEVLIIEGQYTDGKASGIWKYSYDNGQRKLERNMDNNAEIINVWNEEGEQTLQNGKTIHRHHKRKDHKHVKSSSDEFGN